MKLNLTPVEKLINDLMVDECIIQMGPQRQGHGTWDDVTGSYTPDPDQYIYHGQCMVTKQGMMPFASRRGGAEVQVSYYTFRIPMQEIPLDIQEEDIITITDVHLGGDNAIMGQTFTVTAVDDATYSVCHEIRAIKQEAIPG